MTQPKIKITVEGPQGSGKSTLAHYFANLLKHQHGVPTQLFDDGSAQAVDQTRCELENSFNASVTILVKDAFHE